MTKKEEVGVDSAEAVATLPSLPEIAGMRYEDLHRTVSAVRSNTNWTAPQFLMGSGGNTKYAEKRHVPEA